MRIKFNLYERVAGLFVLGAVAGTVGFGLFVAIKKGLFEPKIELETLLRSADGIHDGTVVSMQGLRIGSVKSVELISSSEVRVRFQMEKKYGDKVRTDSVVRVLRPFVIGDKLLDVSIGKPEAPALAEGGTLPSEPTADIMDLVSGKTLGPSLEILGKMAENLKFVAEAFLDPKRSRAIVGMFDDLSPLIKNASALTAEAGTILKTVNKDKQLVRTIQNLAAITAEVNRMLPQFAKESPELITHLSKIAKNMAILTDEVQKTLPMMQQMAPEIPRASARALEALDETVVTLKALQKSFLLRGSAEEVREEEAKRRLPASGESTKGPKH